jgi:hypothetical protein
MDHPGGHDTELRTALDPMFVVIGALLNQRGAERTEGTHGAQSTAVPTDAIKAEVQTQVCAAQLKLASILQTGVIAQLAPSFPPTTRALDQVYTRTSAPLTWREDDTGAMRHVLTSAITPPPSSLLVLVTRTAEIAEMTLFSVLFIADGRLYTAEAIQSTGGQPALVRADRLDRSVHLDALRINTASVSDLITAQTPQDAADAADALFRSTVSWKQDTDVSFAPEDIEDDGLTGALAGRCIGIATTRCGKFRQYLVVTAESDAHVVTVEFADAPTIAEVSSTSLAVVGSMPVAIDKTSLFARLGHHVGTLPRWANEKRITDISIDTAARFEEAYLKAPVSVVTVDQDPGISEVQVALLRTLVPEDAGVLAACKRTVTVCDATVSRPGLKWVTHTALLLENGGKGKIIRCSLADVTELTVLHAYGLESSVVTVLDFDGRGVSVEDALDREVATVLTAALVECASLERRVELFRSDTSTDLTHNIPALFELLERIRPGTVKKLTSRADFAVLKKQTLADFTAVDLQLQTNEINRMIRTAKDDKSAMHARLAEIDSEIMSRFCFDFGAAKMGILTCLTVLAAPVVPNISDTVRALADAVTVILEYLSEIADPPDSTVWQRDETARAETLSSYVQCKDYYLTALDYAYETLQGLEETNPTGIVHLRTSIATGQVAARKFWRLVLESLAAASPVNEPLFVGMWDMLSARWTRVSDTAEIRAIADFLKLEEPTEEPVWRMDIVSETDGINVPKTGLIALYSAVVATSRATILRTETCSDPRVVTLTHVSVVPLEAETTRWDAFTKGCVADFFAKNKDAVDTFFRSTVWRDIHWGVVSYDTVDIEGGFAAASVFPEGSRCIGIAASDSVRQYLLITAHDALLGCVYLDNKNGKITDVQLSSFIPNTGLSAIVRRLPRWVDITTLVDISEELPERVKAAYLSQVASDYHNSDNNDKNDGYAVDKLTVSIPGLTWVTRTTLVVDPPRAETDAFCVCSLREVTTLESATGVTYTLPMTEHATLTILAAAMMEGASLQKRIECEDIDLSHYILPLLERITDPCVDAVDCISAIKQALTSLVDTADSDLVGAWRASYYKDVSFTPAAEIEADNTCQALFSKPRGARRATTPGVYITEPTAGAELPNGRCIGIAIMPQDTREYFVITDRDAVILRIAGTSVAISATRRSFRRESQPVDITDLVHKELASHAASQGQAAPNG